MTLLQIQTHVSDSGVITLPPHAKDIYGKDVVLNIAVDDKPKHDSPLEGICGGWADDKRSTEEIIRDIYESRTIGKRSFEELCGVWSGEENDEDVDRMVAAIHEGRLLGTEQETL